MKVGISSELQEILRVAVEDGMSKEDSKDLRVAGSDPTKLEKMFDGLTVNLLVFFELRGCMQRRTNS